MTKKTCGALTSGGTESILMAVKAYRDYYRKEHPEMIVPVTAHAAFDKAAEYFGIKIIHIPIDDDMKCDIALVKNAITSNTIMIAGSAPQYPHGIIDDIEAMSQLAENHGIGFHTDACLGGFFLPWVKDKFPIPDFDFILPGVTSISCDTHKYGYASKGTSVILFRKPELRRSMYFVHDSWIGGVYASATMAGSRSGGLIACCWASLVAMGEDKYTSIASEIFDTVQEIKSGIRDIIDLKLHGDSYSPVVAFGINSNRNSSLNIYMINDAMKEYGWMLNPLMNPSGVHLCVTKMHIGKGRVFINDLRNSIENVKLNPTKYKTGSTVMYGMASSFPDRSVISDVAKIYLDTTLEVL